MLRLKRSKTIAAAVAGGFALMAVSMSAAQADGDGHGNGHGWGHQKSWKRGHGDWNGGPRVVVRDGYYYAPPPVYYGPPPVYYAPPPPVYYAPPPVYYAPQPAISLQFRL